MELLLIVAVVALGLFVLLGVGAITLLKLGVLARYALTPDRPDTGREPGEYSLEDSREPGREGE